MKKTLMPSALLEVQLLGQPHHTVLPATEPNLRALGPIGDCPHGPVCTWLVIDSSGSVAATYGTDPIARRFDEARLAIHAVAQRCRCQQELVGIAHFDTPTSLDLPPTTLDRHGLRRIERCLAIPPDAAGQSLLRPSLSSVTELADQLPDHEHVIVALTDFLLFDDNLPGLYRDLAGFAGVPHAISLRALPPRELLDDDRVVVTHISANAERGSVAQAVLAALTEHRVT